MATFKLKILTPLAEEFDDDVASLVVPGELGYLGVLANHAPLITSLGRGELKVTAAGGRVRRFQVDGGIMRVENNRAVVLTEAITDLAD